MRRYLVLALESDAGRIAAKRFQDAGVSPIFCHAADALPCLDDVDAVVFAISELSVHSTAYQFLALTVADTAPATLAKWVLMLDQVQIPLGFAAIRELPELSLS